MSGAAAHLRWRQFIVRLMRFIESSLSRTAHGLNLLLARRYCRT
jgi:hypothetical protein